MSLSFIGVYRRNEGNPDARGNSIPNPRSHLINRCRWRGLRFGLGARREEGASPQGAATDEQRSEQPKDRAVAATGIYEMASNLNRNPNRFIPKKEIRIEIKIKITRGIGLRVEIRPDIVIAPEDDGI
jgi:hypothetical protein